MIKKIYFLTNIIITIFLFTACKKKDTDDAARITTEKLIGKWTFENSVVNQHHSNADHINTTPGLPGDYMEFLTSGKVNLKLLALTDTSRYMVIGSDRLVFDQTDTFTIKSLTANDLLLYRKFTYSSATYNEESYTLKK